MTNNFEHIRRYMINEGIPVLENYARDLFFCVMLIRRGKDHPNLPAANYTFKTYYIDSIEKFDKCTNEIIKCCEMFGLRAYVSVNVKSKETFSKYCTFKYSQNVLNNEYKKPWRVIDHVFGKINAANEDRWIVDIDNHSINSKYVKQIIKIIDTCDCSFTAPCITHFNSKSGVHIITHPFNLKQFKDKCAAEGIEAPDIKKNHITLLYENL